MRGECDGTETRLTVSPNRTDRECIRTWVLSRREQTCQVKYGNRMTYDATKNMVAGLEILKQRAVLTPDVGPVKRVLGKNFANLTLKFEPKLQIGGGFCAAC